VVTNETRLFKVFPSKCLVDFTNLRNAPLLRQFACSQLVCDWLIDCLARAIYECTL